MLWNSFLLAVRAIRRNVLRSFLTILGVVIGVSAVIVMMTLGDGATQSVKDQISSLGSNMLQVRPGMRMGPGREGVTRPPNFELADAEALAAQVSGVSTVVPVAGTSATVVYQAENWSTSVAGTTAAYFSAGNWTLAGGRVFTDAEERAGKAVCVIGQTVRKELFGTQNPVGSEIRVKRFGCEVIGMLKAKGGSFGPDPDDVIVMPLRTVQRRLTGNDDVTSMQIAVREDAPVERTTAAITALLRERRNIAENEDDNFSVFDTKQIAETLSGTIRVMTMLLGAVAAISLLVGGIGIMNIMLVSVTERTREIGVRLAIGAVEGEVLLQFLIEAVALSSFGGLVGLALANVVSVFVARMINVPFIFNAGINALSFAFSALIGVVFGYFPARRAAQLDPIDALRYE